MGKVELLSFDSVMPLIVKSTQQENYMNEPGALWGKAGHRQDDDRDGLWSDVVSIPVAYLNRGGQGALSPRPFFDSQFGTLIG